MKSPPETPTGFGASSPPPDFPERWIHALNLIAELTPTDVALLRALPMRPASFAKDQDIVRQGEHPTNSCLILEGFACRTKTLSGGQRQILSFHLPGEMPDLQSVHLDRMDHALCALAPTHVSFVPHEAILAAMSTSPTLLEALWKSTLVDASIFREWLAGIGRRTALQRVAHLFCEIYFRMRLMGLAERGAMRVPLTQSELGDALGITAVHVNRLLQQLRKDALITIRGREIRISDWPRLRDLADFDPAYLHIRVPLNIDVDF